MRGLVVLLSVFVLIGLTANESTTKRGPASEREPSASHTCKIVTGYGTAIGRGSSKLKAKENAREICGSKLIDDYFARRGRIDPEVEDDLILACVNIECS